MPIQANIFGNLRPINIGQAIKIGDKSVLRTFTFFKAEAEALDAYFKNIATYFFTSSSIWRASGRKKSLYNQMKASTCFLTEDGLNTPRMVAVICGCNIPCLITIF